MFGNRRRRAASNPPLNGSHASASAMTAASQAFLRSQASNVSLSSAAAAAALRSQPTTPTSVADVQTKRTMKRAGSTSSAGSSGSGAGRGQPGSQLVRRGSSGSMSERTFRDPSPSRESGPVPSAPNAPPVPAIPKQMKLGASTKSQRRAASLEAPEMRIASPPPNKANGRGSSLGPAGPIQPPRRPGQRSSGLSSVQELTGVERLANRGSVNFSLPTGSRPTSPIGRTRLTSPSPQRPSSTRIASPTNQNLVYDPNTRSFLPQAQLLAIEQSIRDAANKPVRQKKKAPISAGRHLAEGSAGGGPRGTAVDAMEETAAKTAALPIELPSIVPAQEPVPEPVPEPVTAPTLQPPTRRKKKKVIASDSESDQGSYIPNSSDTDSDAAPTQHVFHIRAGQLAKKPSVVREDKEREEQEDDTPTRLKAQNGNLMADTSPESDRNISPSPLPRSSTSRGHGRGQTVSSASYAQELQQTRSVSQPPPDLDSAKDSIALGARNSVRGGRVQSVSPARTTHFANNPESLTVKHQPPARSISPRKSALKQSFNSPRGPSPIEGGFVPGGSIQDSEASIASEDLNVPKKRGNRVSFDEGHIVVGQAASPVVTDSPVVNSPQNKRPWYSIGRGRKKETSVSDDDEIMKPRPALPSFGSVRERKQPRETTAERPLVKPLESSEPPELKLSLPSPPLLTSPRGEAIDYSKGAIGQSNDHIIGAIFSQDATSKNEANISKSREPLPPQVTSVEGNGYHSESDTSLYDTENTKSNLGIGRANSVKRGPDGANAETYQALTSPIKDLDTPVDEKPEQVANENVPRIAVLAATPTVERTVEKKEWLDMPGAWGSSDDSSFQEKDDVTVETVGSTPSTVNVVETPRPIAPIIIPTVDVTAPKSSPITAPIMEETDESDASIYSDAAEDLSVVEGDGFMSLDAMVESPIADVPSPILVNTTTRDSPTAKNMKEKAYRQSQLSRKTSEPDINEGWDKVQSYWSTLSADRKRQLELEARQESDGSDTEVEVKPTPKPKKKKKIVSLPPPPTVSLQPQAHEVVNSTRTYMIQPGARAGPNGHAPPMRTSMRSELASTTTDATHIRKSMRGDGSMRNSLRSDAPESKTTIQRKHRPASLPPHEIRADPTEVSKHVKALSIASAKLAPSVSKKDIAAPAPTPVLRRRGSGDSDSSFKRTRASSDVTNFRRSMRVSNEQDTRAQSPLQSSRFSLRSLSPTSSFRRPFSANNGPPSVNSQTHMRSSMRSSFDTTPSLRTNNPSRMGGFGGSKGSKATKVKPNGPRSSRFADSSDEDEERPSFRSRFDSSDEDEPPLKPTAMSKTMRSTPVRGIPKRVENNDEDSSDLPDSDDEKPGSSGLKLMKKRPQNGKTTASNQGSTLAAGSLRRSGSGRDTIHPLHTPVSAAAASRPNNTRRGSIMSILRRKKPDQDSKVRKSDLESPARRDTPLERSKSDLAAIKADRPITPKLQKRNSDAWPLVVPASPPTIVGGEDGRPFTADTDDGVTGADLNGTARPDIGTRRFTATGLTHVDGLQSPIKGRKKKFGKLRKMFGLDE